ncbi:MAG TPA: hypothetical protein DHV68_08045 [Dehalococcoidia bacterium]|nr:hypothetical protein [Chloroflexota bacterium]HCI86780.1 hypothetical protein [Dehalococcoidia bacterium]|tara:strand:+ start:1201 stop:1389 length:189 start_codon:yes stop_codon:yes gene_type:complete
MINNDERKTIDTAETAAKVAGIPSPVVDAGFREHDQDNSHRLAGIGRDELVVEWIRNAESLN